ncbi:MAG: Crp/Fnr family transcriptional regulator [Bacteroidetes bacterium]|nr:Crp/Fnr family transcriptional regulator [Bacteroidota bacterium]
MFDQLKAYLGKHIDITEEELAVFCSRFRLKTTKRNEILLEGGSVCRNIHFVNKGCLRIYLVDEHARESTRFLVPEGRFGTAFPSFILQEPSKAWIQSIEPSEILLLSYEAFKELPLILPRWEQVYRMNLERDYIDAINRIESLITMDAKERYALLMASNPALIQRLPSKIIADYLGISQETLSRLKSKI